MNVATRYAYQAPELSTVLQNVCEGPRCAILIAFRASPDAPTDYVVILASDEPGAKFRTARCFWGRNDNAFRDASAYYESGAQRQGAGVRR